MRFVSTVIPTLFLLVVFLFCYLWVDAVLSESDKVGADGARRLKAGALVGAGVLVAVGLVFQIGAAVQIGSGRAANGGATWNNPNALVAGNWVLQPIYLALCAVLSAVLVGYSVYALSMMRKAGAYTEMQRRSAGLQMGLYGLLFGAFTTQTVVVAYSLFSERILAPEVEVYVGIFVAESVALLVIMFIMFKTLRVGVTIRDKFYGPDEARERLLAPSDDDISIPEAYRV